MALGSVGMSEEAAGHGTGGLSGVALGSAGWEVVVGAAGWGGVVGFFPVRERMMAVRPRMRTRTRGVALRMGVGLRGGRILQGRGMRVAKVGVRGEMGGVMSLEISTPALLFPAISLLFLSYTNRFLHLSALIRNLHDDWLERGDGTARRQIDNLKRRLQLIRAMQLFGALSLFLCVLSMLGVIAGWGVVALGCFGVALLLMGLSLGCLIREVYISGGALNIMLAAMEEGERGKREQK